MPCGPLPAGCPAVTKSPSAHVVLCQQTVPHLVAAAQNRTHLVAAAQDSTLHRGDVGRVLRAGVPLAADRRGHSVQVQRLDAC